MAAGVEAEVTAARARATSGEPPRGGAAGDLPRAAPGSNLQPGELLPRPAPSTPQGWGWGHKYVRFMFSFLNMDFGPPKVKAYFPL